MNKTRKVKRPKRRPGDPTRSFTAGQAIGQDLVEVGNLMYQNKTAFNFILGLKDAIDKEYNRRLAIITRSPKGAR